MSTIRCIFHGAAPPFPATDQHPDAVRYGPLTIGDATYFVDALGGAPSEAEILAVLSPPAPVPEEISDRQFFQALAVGGEISKDEALAAVKTGVIPASMQPLLEGMSADDHFDAEMMLSGATVFKRHHPMTLALAAAKGWSDDNLDTLWRVAAEL